MAASTVMVLPLIVLFFSAQRYYLEGIQMSGIAGRCGVARKLGVMLAVT